MHIMSQQAGPKENTKKKINYIVTLNIKSLIKLEKITDFLDNRSIMITALQKTQLWTMNHSSQMDTECIRANSPAKY